MKRFFLGLLAILLLAIVALLFWPEKRYEPFQVNDAYQAQVDAYYVPSMPRDWEWKTFVTRDGTRLRWGETGNAEAAKATLIWVPGYTATLDMYGEHFDVFAKQGFHIVGIDMRGQGGSERHRESQPEKLWVSDFNVYSQDVTGFIESLNIPSERPLILTGVSFGGHVVARTVGEFTTEVDGLFLLSLIHI